MILLIILLVFLVDLVPMNAELNIFDDPAITDMDFPQLATTFSGTYHNRLIDPFCPPSKWTDFKKALWCLYHNPRQLTHLGYLWTWQLVQFRPRLWHIVNTAMHAFNVWLVYLLCAPLGGFRPLAIATLYAPHPLHVSAVCYVSGRAALQASMFTLCAFALFLNGHYLLGFISEVFAWKSKEDAPVYMLLFPVFWFFWHTT